MAKTLQDIRLQLQRGEVTSEQLVEEALASVKSSEGQGDKTFIKVYDDKAMVQAKAIDQVRKSGVELHPLAGIPISIKDLFDVAGEITLSGSIVRRKSIPAKYDAHIVSKLRAAGAILIGRTNMTEFAFSGLGINPHYGTPLNPWDRKMGRIPGRFVKWCSYISYRQHGGGCNWYRHRWICSNTLGFMWFDRFQAYSCQSI